MFDNQISKHATSFTCGRGVSSGSKSCIVRMLYTDSCDSPGRLLVVSCDPVMRSMTLNKVVSHPVTGGLEQRGHLTRSSRPSCDWLWASD